MPDKLEQNLANGKPAYSSMKDLSNRAFGGLASDEDIGELRSLRTGAHSHFATESERLAGCESLRQYPPLEAIVIDIATATPIDLKELGLPDVPDGRTPLAVFTVCSGVENSVSALGLVLADRSNPLSPKVALMYMEYMEVCGEPNRWVSPGGSTVLTGTKPRLSVSVVDPIYEKSQIGETLHQKRTSQPVAVTVHPDTDADEVYILRL
jgi:hypothetical protein